MIVDTLGEIKHACMVFRYVVLLNITHAMRKMGLSNDQIDDVIALGITPGIYDASSLISKSFTASSGYVTPFPRSRYSDGTFGACYTSCEEETARSEIAHHMFIGARVDGLDQVDAYYCLIEINFSGAVVDLRPYVSTWPQLIHPTDYGFCQQAGREAIERHLSALLAPSARRDKGTNIPIFIEKCITILGDEAKRITFDVNSKSAIVSSL